MKKDIHPEYKEVIFQDTSIDYKFMTRSTLPFAWFRYTLVKEFKETEFSPPAAQLLRLTWLKVKVPLNPRCQ